MSAILEFVTSQIGQWLAGVMALLAVVGGAWIKGRQSAKRDRAAKDAKDYRDERKDIDDEVSGIGGADADRVKQLHDIADRRGGGKD